MFPLDEARRHLEENARHDLHALEWLGLHFSRRDVVATRNKLAANNLSLTTLS